MSKSVFYGVYKTLLGPGYLNCDPWISTEWQVGGPLRAQTQKTLHGEDADEENLLHEPEGVLVAPRSSVAVVDLQRDCGRSDTRLARCVRIEYTVCIKRFPERPKVPYSFPTASQSVFETPRSRDGLL